MSNDERSKRSAIGVGTGIAVGAGLGLGAAAAITLARRPGLRAHLKAKYNTLFSSGEEKALAKLNISNKIPEASVQNARRMIHDLKRQGYSFDQIKKMRIGIAGSTGSGKSSLARAIEQELGMTRMSLDEFVSYMPYRSGNVDINAAIKAKGGVKPGTVVEQSQLLHTGDPSHFDVIMKIERPAEDIKRGLIERGHAAVTADYVNISKAQTTVNEAFNTVGGKRRRLGQGIEMIIKPQGGKTAETLRLERARELGLNIEEFSRMSRRDQIQSLANRANRTGQSFRSHISSGALGHDLSIAGGLAVTGGVTGGYMSKESSAGDCIDAIMSQIDAHFEKRAFAGAATAAAIGAVGGGAIGALAGGEGNRGAGFMTGAMLGAGAGLGAAKLTGGLGRLATGGRGLGTVGRARGTLAREMNISARQLTDDLVIGPGGRAVEINGRLLKAPELQRLRIEAASNPRVAKQLRDAGVLEGKVNTAGGQVKFRSELEAAYATGDPAKIERVYNRAVKSGAMSEAQAAQQLRFTNPERFEAFQAAEANAQLAAQNARPAAQAAPQVTQLEAASPATSTPLNNPFKNPPAAQPPATTPTPTYTPPAAPATSSPPNNPFTNPPAASPTASKAAPPAKISPQPSDLAPTSTTPSVQQGPPALSALQKSKVTQSQPQKAPQPFTPQPLPPRQQNIPSPFLQPSQNPFAKGAPVPAPSPTPMNPNAVNPFATSTPRPSQNLSRADIDELLKQSSYAPGVSVAGSFLSFR